MCLSGLRHLHPNPHPTLRRQDSWGPSCEGGTCLLRTTAGSATHHDLPLATGLKVIGQVRGRERPPRALGGTWRLLQQATITSPDLSPGS